MFCLLVCKFFIPRRKRDINCFQLPFLKVTAVCVLSVLPYQGVTSAGLLMC